MRFAISNLNESIPYCKIALHFILAKIKGGVTEGQLSEDFFRYTLTYINNYYCPLNYDYLAHVCA